jgi:glycerol kinase
MLPEVRASSEIYAETTTSLTGAGTPLAGMIGDQQGALAGQLCVDPGAAKNTYGTGCFLLLNTGETAETSRNRLLTTVAWRRGTTTEYALEGSVFIGGAVVQWLRDGLGLIRKSSEIEALAASVPDNGGVYLVPAFVGLGAPHWDQYARGTIVGLSRGTTAGHIARAALEGIAFQVADLLDAMRRDSQVDIPELRVDGGAAVNDTLLQFQADILGLPVVRPTVLETTALGAAYMAGLATGYWQDLDELRANWQVDRRFEPQQDPGVVRAQREKWTAAVERARAWEQPEHT